ncbi:MAG: UvrD-helicase domain-containing protein [Trueperaceae bacterium]
MAAADPVHRWWQAPGPWRAQVEAPPRAAPAPLDLWTMLLGGEPTMPLTTSSRWVQAATPRPRRSPRVLTPSVEGVLAWARRELEVRAAERGSDDGRDEARGSVAFRVRGDHRVRWRAHTVREVRDAARAVAGWDAAPAAGGAIPVATTPPAGAPALTAAQRAVVVHDGGRAVVLAVAGAGKTTTMVARVRHRVATGRCDPAATLVVSFSRAAVAAVRAKLDADPTTAAVEARTFHALAHRLLALSDQASGAGRSTRPPTGPAADDVVAAVVRIARREATDRDPDLADAWRAANVVAFEAYRGRALARLELPGLATRALPASAIAEARPPPPDPDHPAHPALLEDFERVRAARGWLDHDQLLVEAWAAMHGDPAVVVGARGRWRTWLIDEAQDLNAVQLALLERLTAGRDDVVLVGDDDQAIYGFRGSTPGLLRGYAAKHRARVLVLDEAFRSRAEPLAIAAALMARSSGTGTVERAQLRPRAVRGPGGALTLDVGSGPDGEARALLTRARAHHRAGLAWRDQAVLLRRFDQAPALERAAMRQGVPLRLEGVAPLVRHPEVVAAWAGVALALGALHDASPATRERAWRRWLMGPAGQTRPAALASARALADASGAGARAWREHAPRGADPTVGARLTAIAAAADDAARALSASGTDPRTWPAGPGARLRAALDLLGDAAPTPAAEAYAAWRRAARARAPDDAVLVTSVHRAKGLEWPVVHVPGMTAGVFPTGSDPEERRLAYVGWTRARDALHLYRDGRRPPSPFLADGDVADVIALARDLAHLQCAQAKSGRGPRRLAAVWALREATERFGTPLGRAASPTAPETPSGAR